MIDSWCSLFSEHEKFTRFFEGLSRAHLLLCNAKKNELKRKFASAILMQRSLRSLVHRSPARNPIKRYTSPYAKTIYFGSLVHASILIQKRKGQKYLWIFEASLACFSLLSDLYEFQHFWWELFHFFLCLVFSLCICKHHQELRRWDGLLWEVNGTL